MKRKFLCLLLALTLVLGLAATVSAATDSTGRCALNNNDYTHAYVVKGDILNPEFYYDTVDAPCASPVWVYQANLTGRETQAELDDLAYELLTSGENPLFYTAGWTHSINTNRQSCPIETADLELGTYLIVAAAMSDYRFCCDGGIEFHYETATGVGMHVVEQAVPIETYEYWYCDADGNEVQKLSADEAFIISHANGSPLYRFKIKTYPENATERVIRMSSSMSTEDRYDGGMAIPGFTFEDDMYGTCAQCCGTGYFWLDVDSYGESEEAYSLCHNIAYEVPCHQNGPVKVRQWYTCTEPGYKAAYCYGYGTTCDTVYGYEIMDPPGHTLKEVYEIITAPTATKSGLGVGLCKSCQSRGVEGHIPAIFSDVASDAFYSDALDHVYEYGWVNGLTENTFGPNGSCLRSQVVTFLWRAAGKPVVDFDNPFVDVKPTDYYYDAVLWAVSEGITNGLDDTHFGPNETCSRSQVVTFLWRAADEPIVRSENPFSDVKPTDYYYDAVLWAAKNGVTNGITPTTFAPFQICNRSQVVTFLYRADNIPETETYTFELLTNDPSEETGFVEVEGTEFAAGESVIFYAEPWYGYLVEFTIQPEGITPELYYLGGNYYELIMPESDVVLTAHFVPATGSYQYINLNAVNCFAVANCLTDEDGNDIAKAGEYVQILVVPDEGFSLADATFTANGETVDWWYLGSMEDGSDVIHVLEMVMPGSDVDITITCTPGTDPAAAEIRIPVSLG